MNNLFVPLGRPKITRKEVLKELGERDDMNYAIDVIVYAKRGYYLNTMGKRGKNDRGIYDDAIVITSDTVHATFNGNTDPSIYRPGIAVLEPGDHLYRPGIHGLSKPKHRQYPAFRPATKGERLPVRRDGKGEITEAVAINIHKGSMTSTSSEGCQTIYPLQWEAFYALLMEQLNHYKRKTFIYALRY